MEHTLDFSRVNTKMHGRIPVSQEQELPLLGKPSDFLMNASQVCHISVLRHYGKISNILS